MYPSDSGIDDVSSSSEILKSCRSLSFHLSYYYMLWGQSDSSYSEGGNIEYLAFGIRRFLSIPENCYLLRKMGKDAIKRIIKDGTFFKSVTEKEYQEKKHYVEAKKSYEQTLKDIKKVDKNVYEYIIKAVKKKSEKYEKKIAKIRKKNQKESKEESKKQIKKNEKETKEKQPVKRKVIRKKNV